jgi:hypothetical protein
MFFLTSFFEHLRFFTAAARSRGAQGEFQLGSMNATVRAEGRCVQFLAQFLTHRPDGSLTYAMEFGPQAPGFVGWLPYFNKRWVEAYDKLAFRRRCSEAGLPLPRACTALQQADLGDFVVKAARGSSFGQGVRGPFAAGQRGAIALAPGEYAEEFIHGQVGKAWYWNDRVVAIELRHAASVTGDGINSLGALVQRGRRTADLTRPAGYLAYRGLRWDDVPARGETVQVDYKYASPYERFEYRSQNRMQELHDGPVVAQLNGWGPIFWGFVPPHIRPGTLYTVDFIAPPSGSLRLLEMNCNPMVPPEIYEVIFAAAFGAPGELRLTGTEQSLLEQQAAPGPGQPAMAMAEALAQPTLPSVPLGSPSA